MNMLMAFSFQKWQILHSIAKKSATDQSWATEVT